MRACGRCVCVMLHISLKHTIMRKEVGCFNVSCNKWKYLTCVFHCGAHFETQLWIDNKMALLTLSLLISCKYASTKIYKNLHRLYLCVTKSVPYVATFDIETLKVLSLGIAITIRHKFCVEIRSRIRFQK